MAAVPSIGRASLVEPAARAPQAAVTAGLYERHSGKLFGYCYHQLGSREEAEDAVQTTFMNAFRALGRGVVPESETAWLYKIAENVCLSRRRSSWRRGRIESPSDFEVIEEIVPGPSRQRDELIGIEDALANMPEQQRRAILLREWQGLSYREIAEELEVSQSAVETLIFRARRSLAQGLEQPETLRKPKRKCFRRALHAVDLGTAFAAIKTFLAGSAAVKATAAAVAVTAAAGSAAGVESKLEGKRHGSVQAPPAVVAPVAAKPAEPVVAAAYAPQTAASAPVPVPAAAASKPVVNGSKRPPQKIAEKATAKPPVHKRQAAPVAAAPAATPAPVAASAPAERAERSRAAEPKAKEGPKPQEGPKAKDEPKAEPTRAPQAVREERKDEKQAEKAAAPKRNGNGNGKHAEPAPAPASVVASLEVLSAVEADAKKGRKGGDEEPLAEMTEVAVAVAAPSATAVAPAVEAPADAANGNGKGLGKDK